MEVRDQFRLEVRSRRIRCGAARITGSRAASRSAFQVFQVLEIPVGLNPVAAIPQGRLVLEDGSMVFDIVSEAIVRGPAFAT